MGSGSTFLPIGLKAKYSFYSALVFFLAANPETYKEIKSAAREADKALGLTRKTKTKEKS